MHRRTLFAASAAAALAAPATAQPARVLKFVPQANLTSLDPIWTTANVTRNHGYMVFDTLYGMDAQFRPQPQMASGHQLSDDRKEVTITLREGLRFHDNEPVRAADCVASLQRWMKRNPSGQQLERALDELAALDDRRLRFRLKKPFPLLLAALASPVNPVAFMMPERLARTDPFQQVRETIGSGPFRFLPGEFNSGSRVTTSATPTTCPSRKAPPASPPAPSWSISTASSGTSSPTPRPPPPPCKPARSTGTSSRRRRSSSSSAATARSRSTSIDPLPLTAILRFNHLHRPSTTSDAPGLPARHRAGDFMAAIVGNDPDLIRTGVGIFTPGTRSPATSASNPSRARARSTAPRPCCARPATPTSRCA
jgi:peptide/nickel transport system substrate-binding protein